MTTHQKNDGTRTTGTKVQAPSFVSTGNDASRVEAVVSHSKANRARNIVKLTLGKTKRKEFTVQVDAVLNAVQQLYMLEHLCPKEQDRQKRAAVYTNERNDAYQRLIKAQEKLLSLV